MAQVLRKVDFSGLSGLMRLGLSILAFGLALDLLYHTAPIRWLPTLDLYLGTEAFWAHLVTFVGMMLASIGLFKRPSRRPRTK